MSWLKVWTAFSINWMQTRPRPATLSTLFFLIWISLVPMPSKAVAEGLPSDVRAQLNSRDILPESVKVMDHIHDLGHDWWRLAQVSTDGTEVLNSGLVVVDSPGEVADSITGHVVPVSNIPPLRVSETVALKTVEPLIGSDEKQSPGLGIWGQGANSRLVWSVRTGRGEALVDATTGNVISTTDVVENFESEGTTGQARAFLSSPFEQAGFYDLGLPQRTATGVTPDLFAYTPVTLLDLYPDQNCLKGPYLRVFRIHDPIGVPGDVCKAGRDWSDVTRDDLQFTALNAWYHLTAARRMVQETGVENAGTRSIEAVVNYGDTSANPLHPGQYPNNSVTGWSEETLSLSYAAGCFEDGPHDGNCIGPYRDPEHAEDPDVLVHEFGHSVIDQQWQDHLAPNYSAGLAYAEAFGDYLAANYSEMVDPQTTVHKYGISNSYWKVKDPGRACYANDQTWCLGDPSDSCIGEWALGNCTRQLGSFKTYPEQYAACNVEPHCLGEAWGSLFWSVHKDINDRAESLKLALVTNRLLGGNMAFQDAGPALLNANAALHGSQYEQAIRARLAARGFLDHSDTCRPPKSEGVVLMIDDSGSMQGTDPNSLRARALKLALDYLPDGTSVAISTFESAPHELTDGAVVLNDGSRSMLKDLVGSSLHADGGTDYSAAFNEANHLLDQVTGDSKAVIFFSDGEPNGLDYGPAYDALVDRAPVYALGLGDQSQDMTELKRLASESGGKFYRTRYFDEVQAVFAYMIGGIFCEFPLVSQVKDINAGDTQEIPFSVSARDPSLVATASWSWGGGKATLFRPDGTEVESGSLQRNERVSRSSGYATFGIADPDPGTWKLAVTAADGPGTDTYIRAAMTASIRNRPEKPALVQLVSPINDAVPFGSTAFAWNDARGADRYSVLLDGNELANDLSGLSFTAMGLSPGTHTWKVQAKNAFGESVSDSATFTITAASTAPPNDAHHEDREERVESALDLFLESVATELRSYRRRPHPLRGTLDLSESGTIQMKAETKDLTIASATARISTGQPTGVPIHLTSKGKKALRSSKRLRVTLTAGFASSELSLTGDKKVTLSAP